MADDKKYEIIKPEKKEKDKSHEKFSITKYTKLLIIAIILLIILIIVIGVATSKEGKFTVKEVRSDFVNYETISELRSAEYIYNGVETKKDANGNVEYYVKYEGKVKAGLDPKKIKTVVDEENKKIIIYLPRMEILDVYVDETKIDYIKKKWTLDNEKIHPEAYNFAKEKIKERAENNPDFHREAIKNAKYIITAAYSPFLDINGVKYKLEFADVNDYKGVE